MNVRNVLLVLGVLAVGALLLGVSVHQMQVIAAVGLAVAVVPGVATLPEESSETRLAKMIDGLGTDVRGRLDNFDARVKALEVKYGAGAETIPGLGDEIRAEGKKGRRFSFVRAILGIRTGDWKGSDAEYEHRIMTDAMNAAKANGRALSSSVGADGGYLVPQEVLDETIEFLRAATVVEELGATPLNDLTGSPVTITKQTGGATGYWVGENSAVTASQQAFGEINLTPHEAAAHTAITNRLLRLNSHGAEEMVRRDLFATVGRLCDLAYLRGSGAGAQPQGIRNIAGIGSVSKDANPDVDLLDELIYQLELNNAPLRKTGWAFHPRTKKTLAQLKDGQGRNILLPSPNSPFGGDLKGLPYKTTTAIPINLGSTTDESEIFCADWSEVIVANWGGFFLAVSNQAGTSFVDRQTLVLVTKEVDVALRHTGSLAICPDVRDD